jgi:hypothetical protein
MTNIRSFEVTPEKAYRCIVLKKCLNRTILMPLKNRQTGNLKKKSPNDKIETGAGSV